MKNKQFNFIKQFWIISILHFHSCSATESPHTATGNPRILEHPDDTYVSRTEPATLNCKADGDPAPIITWYRDGQLVVTANENPSSHRMLLPSGQLFFLRVVHNKNSRLDVGEYYCNATNPETKVSVISRTAKLDIAVIRDEFRVQPQSVEVALGQDASLHCVPPRGEPEPKFRWEKNGELVTPDDRISLDAMGTLLVRRARKEDSGSFVCVGFNVGGERESLPALLSVREVPQIVDPPKDTVVKENEEVLLQCQATGDPEPVIIWKKLEGQIPAERSQILVDRSLKIEHAQVTDEGRYVCRMENSVGWQEAEAKLTVLSRPSFVVTPRDKTAGVGRKVVMRCEMTGNPAPAVFWTTPNTQKYLFVNQAHGRFRVTEEGTLMIEGVTEGDAGEYSCQGISMAGTAYAKTRLTVKEIDPRPPPIITQGPQNQTLPMEGTASMACSAIGEPKPVVQWLKDRAPLAVEGRRISITDQGTLTINNLQHTDAGLYTCLAASDSGQTAWSATLLVEMQTNTNVVFRRTPDPSAFPSPPGKPVISDVTETSLRVQWRPGTSQGASAVESYTLEYYSQDTGEGWLVAANKVEELSFQVINLQPSTRYVFLVRARNTHGFSHPSPLSDSVKTNGDAPLSGRPSVPQFELELVREKLSFPLIHLNPAEVLSSTAIKLTWETRRNQRYIEGFYVKYRASYDLEIPPDGAISSRNGAEEDFISETVLSSTASVYVLSSLHRYTWYEIRIQPFYSTVLGAESNIVRAMTLEDVPSAPPQNIRTTMLENNTLHISWESPPKRHQNGPLRGYTIYLTGNETKFNHQIYVNLTTMSIYLRHLVKDMRYRLQMTARNRMGEGVLSDIIYLAPMDVCTFSEFGHEPISAMTRGVLGEPWLIGTLVATIGAALWLALCLFSVWIYRRHRAHKQLQKNRPVSVPVRRVQDSVRNGGMYVPNQVPLLNGNSSGCHGNQTLLPPCCYDNESPSDGDTKGNGSLQFGGQNTYQSLDAYQNGIRSAFTNSEAGWGGRQTLPGEVAPPAYNHPSRQRDGGSLAGGSACIPDPQAYMIQSTLNQSGSGGNSDGGPRLLLPPPPDQLSHSDLSTVASNLSDNRSFNQPHNNFMLQSLPGNGFPNPHNPYFGQGDPRFGGHTDVDQTGNYSRNLTDPRSLTYNMFGCDLYPNRESNNFNQADLYNHGSDQLYSQPLGNEDWYDEEQEASDMENRSGPSLEDRLFIDEENFNDIPPQSADFVDPDFLLGDSQLDYRNKVKKTARQRQRAPRPSSPYSTDSSYSTAANCAPQRRPYPKSERRKQLIMEREGSRGRSPQNSGSFRGQGSANDASQNRCERKDSLNSDTQRQLRSIIPYATSNNSSFARGRTQPNPAVPSLPVAPATCQSTSQSVSSASDMQTNPLNAFDTTNTPIV